MRYVITGGSGYIGTRLVEFLTCRAKLVDQPPTTVASARPGPVRSGYASERSRDLPSPSAHRGRPRGRHRVSWRKSKS